ncbi:MULTISPECIES: hypothetical protein [Lysinibacillus]|nr:MULTISPECIES: hypothetical protein [Lysinibacillus]
MRFVQAILLFICIYVAAYLFLYDGSVFKTVQYSVIMWTIVVMIKR